jgi:aryl-alcohol dehydrogenase-like predicted oxidoreductase
MTGQATTRRAFGRTELQVSPVAFGTFGLGGGWGEVSADAIAALRRAYDLGINFIDTAWSYGAGEAESTIGRTLADIISSDRDELVIATKGGLEKTPGGSHRNSDASYLRAMLAESLRSLGTDHADIYLIHWPDPTIDLAETADALAGLVQAGMTRHIGVSNFTVEQMRQFSEGARIEVAQFPYNLFRRGIEAEHLPYCQENDIAVMAYQPYAGGLLTGAISRDTTFATADWRTGSPEYGGEMLAQEMDVIDELKPIAAKRGCTVAQLALAFVRASPHQVVPVTGAERSDLVDSTVDGLSVDLSPDEWTRLTQLAERLTPIEKGGPPARQPLAAPTGLVSPERDGTDRPRGRGQTCRRRAVQYEPRALHLGSRGYRHGSSRRSRVARPR